MIKKFDYSQLLFRVTKMLNLLRDVEVAHTREAMIETTA